ncbi:MAG: hypothetical protein OEV50_03345, partial [Candidatus Aminicenantes bacterium]|nr:hypothetical protein [Candidatus Aminicenantes bacterium]
IHDIYKVNLETEKFLNLTDDDIFEKAPSISPDGKHVVYTIRLDAYDKLFLSSLNNLKEKTQLTFGKGDTIVPHFSPDSKEVYFSGDIRGAYNIYSLNLETGEQKRYTDVRTGNFFPVPLPNEPQKIVFCSFNKGALQLFMSEFEGEVEKTVAFDEKAPEEEFEKFEPLVSLEINEEKIKSHKGLGKLYLTGRPPIDTYIASDGSIFGGSALSFSDILGDYTLYAMAYQVRTFRSYLFSYINQKKRFQFSTSAFQFTYFFYLYSYYDTGYYDMYSYRDAVATQKITGVNFNGYYPFNRFYRLETSVGYYNYEMDYAIPVGTQYPGFLNGNIVSADLALVGETTRFKYPFGPLAGNTFRVSLSQALPISNSFIQNTTAQSDFRQYLNLGSDFVLAFRFKGFASRGKNPYIFYWGGNNQVRSVQYYTVVGNEGWYANLEFRFPIINAASTIIGQIGPVRGTLFFDITRSKVKGFPAQVVLYEYDEFGYPVGWRLNDAIGSYGYGFQFFFLGLPMHLEFAKLIEIPDFSQPFSMHPYGKFRVNFWIGYDF